MKSSAVQTLWKRRGTLRIMAEIMEVVNGGRLKNRIMYEVNLSFSQVNEYLSFLTEMGFLRVCVENRRRVYETTDKGRLYVENYLELSNFLKKQGPVE